MIKKQDSWGKIIHDSLTTILSKTLYFTICHYDFDLDKCRFSTLCGSKEILSEQANLGN